MIVRVAKQVAVNLVEQRVLVLVLVVRRAKLRVVEVVMICLVSVVTMCGLLVVIDVVTILIVGHVIIVLVMYAALLIMVQHVDNVTIVTTVVV